MGCAIETFRVEGVDDVYLIRLTGQLGERENRQLYKALLLIPPGARRVLLDCAGLEPVDGAAVTCFVGMLRLATQRQLPLGWFGFSEANRATLDGNQLLPVFRMVPDLKEGAHMDGAAFKALLAPRPVPRPAEPAPVPVVESDPAPLSPSLPAARTTPIPEYTAQLEEDPEDADE